MRLEQAWEIFRRTGVMLEGHFRFTSGLHSDRYMQCARLFQYPAESARVCEEIAEAFQGKNVDVVVGPALGGIIIAYEVARVLGARSLFAEREEGVMTLRRGFADAVTEGCRALVTEDVVTTGGSTREVMELLRGQGVEVVGVGTVVDRSNGTVDFGVTFYALATLDMKAWDAADCPLCRQGVPLIKPGSRK